MAAVRLTVIRVHTNPGTREFVSSPARRTQGVVTKLAGEKLCDALDRSDDHRDFTGELAAHRRRVAGGFATVEGIWFQIADNKRSSSSSRPSRSSRV